MNPRAIRVEKTCFRAQFRSKSIDSRKFWDEKHGSARFSNRKTWIRALFGSRIMDPHVFRDEKHGSARFSGRKTWIRTLFGTKNMDPRTFRVEKHGSACVSGSGFESNVPITRHDYRCKLFAYFHKEKNYALHYPAICMIVIGTRGGRVNPKFSN